MTRVEVEFGKVQGERGPVALHLWGDREVVLVEMHLPLSATVRDVFERMHAHGSEVAKKFFLDPGRTPRFWAVYVNDVDTRSRQDLDTPLEYGDHIFITTLTCALFLDVLVRDTQAAHRLPST